MYGSGFRAEGLGLDLGTHSLGVDNQLPIGTVLNLRITTSQKCAAVPRRART